VATINALAAKQKTLIDLMWIRVSLLTAHRAEIQAEEQGVVRFGQM